MKVVMISRVTMNPYVRLLGAALQEVEPGLTCAYEEMLSHETVACWQGKADVLHIHWADVLVRGRSTISSLRKLANLTLALAEARRAGIAVVYTAHNLRRSGDGVALPGALAEAAVYRFARAVHVHDDDAQRELLKLRRPPLLAVIAHGNYIGAYPDMTTRAEARRRLAIAESSFVFLALGQIRPYKGLDDLITAFSRLPGDNLHLVIAGHPHDPAYGAGLAQQAASDSRVQIVLRFVADDAVQYYMRAADVCVLPYRSGTTSGAAILAFSFGCPVIAPDASPFRGLVVGDSGLLYAAGPEGLAQALQAAPRLDMARASAAALAVARSLDWQPIARQHVAVYRAITETSHA